MDLSGGDDERETIVALGVEGGGSAGAAGVGCAAGALGRELPVGAVDAVTGCQLLECGRVVDGGLGVRTKSWVSS